ncbi:pentapeptide repeat-containing protein [Corynebacterium sp. ES2794-CONJ1]|uniref:pentapeptide repeat-containing protein n=1 Tax=Corynebacterium sp. ES2794-CONJ1 TaxID=2980553 RepID=UPI0021DB3941|nr:pentapeptide repeat-containing protein [Corynebacterium sp. ES2794-CONJ1]MCU9518931.1 pentapeptide repeat-containing protein [Corynebacterium sp. ES2794-CONJ1]
MAQDTGEEYPEQKTPADISITPESETPLEATGTEADHYTVTAVETDIDGDITVELKALDTPEEGTDPAQVVNNDQALSADVEVEKPDIEQELDAGVVEEEQQQSATQEKLNAVKQEGAKKLHEASEKFSEASEKVKEGATEKFQETSAKFTETTEKVREGASEKFKETSTKLTEATEKVKLEAGEKFQEASEKLQDSSENFQKNWPSYKVRMAALVRTIGREIANVWGALKHWSNKSVLRALAVSLVIVLFLYATLASLWLGDLASSYQFAALTQVETFKYAIIALVASAYFVFRYWERRDSATNQLAEDGLSTDRRLDEAMEKLGSDSPQVRIAGIYTLADVADIRGGSYKQRVVDILCGYLRSHRGDDTDGERAVESTIFGVFSEHLVSASGLETAAGKKQLKPIEQLWSDCRFDFRHAYFISEVDLSQASFDSVADFSGATFTRPAVFNYASFDVDPVFTDAQFLAEASFFHTVFRQGAWFGGANFTEDVRFGNAQFRGNVNFSRARFEKDLWLSGVTFAGDTFFGEAKINDKASFVSSTFTGHTDFQYTTFGGETIFDGARFAKGVWFLNSVFYQKVSFRDASFDAHSGFNGATFSAESIFDAATFYKDAQFEGARFKGTASFGSEEAPTRMETGSSFDSAEIEVSDPPVFEVDPVVEYLVFNDAQWPDSLKSYR